MALSSSPRIGLPSEAGGPQSLRGDRPWPRRAVSAGQDRVGVQLREESSVVWVCVILGLWMDGLPLSCHPQEIKLSLKRCWAHEQFSLFCRTWLELLWALLWPSSCCHVSPASHPGRCRSTDCEYVKNALGSEGKTCGRTAGHWASVKTWGSATNQLTSTYPKGSRKGVLRETHSASEPPTWTLTLTVPLGGFACFFP